MDGYLLIDRTEIPVTEREMLMMATIEPVLKKMGLSLYCERCHFLGHRDGIECKNHPNDRTWTISCQCAVRTWKRAAPAPIV